MSIDREFEVAVRACMARQSPESFPSSAEWVGIGWVVHVQSTRFRETRHFEDQLVGGASLYFEGTVIDFSGARSIDKQIVEFADARGLGDRVLPWVRERTFMVYRGPPNP